MIGVGAGRVSLLWATLRQKSNFPPDKYIRRVHGMDKRRWGVTCPCAQQVNSPIVPQSCVRAGVDLSTKGEEREGICRCVSGREGNRRRRRGGTGSHLAELKIRSNRGFRAPTIEILRRLAKNIFLPSTFHIPPFVVEIKKIYRETRKFLSLSLSSYYR